MPTATTLTKRDYNKLLTDLRSIIREGKEEAERAATQALIESYWSIGKRIAKKNSTPAPPTTTPSSPTSPPTSTSASAPSSAPSPSTKPTNAPRASKA